MKRSLCALTVGGLALCLLSASARTATLVVTNANDSGPGSLRQAITDANVVPGADAIQFNIAPGGWQGIYLDTDLPAITDTLTLDGTTQPGHTGVPLLTIYAPGGSDGLDIAATNCVVRGVDVVNGRNGVVLRATARGAVLGGTNGGAGNSFRYCDVAGVRIEGGSGHVIQGNAITQNGSAGLYGSAGVVVLDGTNHAIRANSIYGNGALGIDLGGDGVTANDNDDPDTGPNQLQNHPLISTAVYSASGLTVTGTLNSRPSRAFILDFYSNLACDDSGSGEGQRFLGSASVTTAGGGNANFNVTLTNAPVGRFVTATATDPAGNTSEFSPCARFTSTVGPATFTVTNVNDAGAGSLRQAILDSNARFANAPNTIAFNIPGAGVHHILLTSDVLPPITEPVIIDGYTQPGSSVNTASNAFNGVVRIRLDGILLGYGRALDITAGNSTVRGLNLMNFASAAVACTGGGSNTIAGNLIGVTADGEMGPTGPAEASVFLSSSSGNLIGGTNRAARNVVAGCSYGDIRLQTSSSNWIAGNFFGSDVTGTNGLWSGGFGVLMDDSPDNVIGGTNDAARNVCLGHSGNDIHMWGPGSIGTVIQGNFMGVGADGHQPPDQLGGLILFEGRNTLIGGTNTGAGNVIAGQVSIYCCTGNAILRNSILGQGKPAIELGNDGPTPNDPDDSDTGANDLQNYPEILSAVRYPDRTVIRSRLQSIPNATYRVDFYDNDRPPPSGYAEAQVWLGATNVTLGANGQTSFNWRPAASLPAGHWVTATATDATNNTSELAPAVIVALSNAVNLTVALTPPTGPVSRTSNFTYTVEVRNLGPTNATGVVLSNLLPANVSFLSATATQGSCVHSAGVVTCTLGTVTSGGLATVVLTVQPQTNGLAQLTARASATETEAYPADNVAVGGPIVGIADIDVVEGHLVPDSVAAGQTFDTVVTVTNLGPDAAFVRCAVTWTPPAIPVSITTAQGTVPIPVTAYFEADIGTLPAGGSSTFTVRSLNASEGSCAIFIAVGGDASDPDGQDYWQGSPLIGPGPGLFNLENGIQQVNEANGVATLRVRRTGGAVGTATVSYLTSPGSATPGADYSPASGTLTFVDGETEQFIAVPVREDLEAECPETFTVSLFNPTGGTTFVYGGNTNCVVQILDNDPTLRGVVTGVSVAATNASAAGAAGLEDFHSISGDGRFVAFSSSANDLIVAGETGGAPQVFVRNLLMGTTTLASVNHFGTNGANAGSYEPQLTVTGSYLAFRSPATDLVTNDNSSPGNSQIYLRDLASGATRLVSVSASGAGAVAGHTWNLLITRDGLGVAFTCSASDVTGVPDVNGLHDVFFRDVAAGVTRLVSVNRWGTATGNHESYLSLYPGSRLPGRYVGFTSYASDLVVGDNNDAPDVFVHDLTNGVTTLVSANVFGTGSGNGGSFDPLLSADGRYVLFYSYASDLVANDANERWDIFVRDWVAGVTALVSAKFSGTGSGNGDSWHSGISEDGRFALFSSDASDLVPNDGNAGTDVFVRDLLSGTTLLVSLNCTGTGSGNGRSYNPSISPDGRYVAFTSDATDLVPGAGGYGHAYLRDLVTGTTTFLTANWRLSASASGACWNALVADGAATVAFMSSADDLLPIDRNKAADVFAWRPLASNTVDLVVDQVNSADLVGPGCSVTYTVTVVNRGPTNATGVVLTDTLPAGATFLSATPSQGSCSHAAGVVTCPLGTLNMDGTATAAIVVQLPASGVVTNRVWVTASEAEPLSANNTSAESLLITRMLSITRSEGLMFITTWACAPAECVLEGAATLPPAGSWTPVPASVIDQGASRTLVVPITIDWPLRFFRLRCP